MTSISTVAKTYLETSPYRHVNLSKKLALAPLLLSMTLLSTTKVVQKRIMKRGTFKRVLISLEYQMWILAKVKLRITQDRWIDQLISKISKPETTFLFSPYVSLRIVCYFTYSQFTIKGKPDIKEKNIPSKFVFHSFVIRRCKK